MANVHPFYKLADIQSMVADGNWDFVNDRAEANYDSYGWNEDKLIQFISCLKPNGPKVNGDFRRSFSLQDIFNGTDVVNTDAYKMHFDEVNMARGTASDSCCYYIKLAILNDQNGSYVGITSFHLDH